MPEPETTQPSVTHETRTDLPRPETVDTPWGTATVGHSLSIGRQDESVEAFGILARTSAGQANLSFHFDVSEGAPPATLRACFVAGSRPGGSKETPGLKAGGKVLSWVANARLDPKDGAVVGDVEVLVTEGKAVGRSIFPPVVRDAVIDASLAEAVRECLAFEDAGDYAGRIYRALAAWYLADVTETAELARKTFVRAARCRDVAEAAMRSPGVAFGEAGDEPAVEIRGFVGEAGVNEERIDEVVVRGSPSFHLETMSDDHVWMGVGLADGRRVSVNVTRTGKRLGVSAFVE